MTTDSHQTTALDGMITPLDPARDAHHRLLEASGLVEAAKTMNEEHVIIDEETFAEQLLIAYDAHVLPYAVVKIDERTLLVRVDRRELEREGYTEKELKAILEDILIPQVDLQVVDVPPSF